MKPTFHLICILSLVSQGAFAAYPTAQQTLDSQRQQQHQQAQLPQQPPAHYPPAAPLAPVPQVQRPAAPPAPAVAVIPQVDHNAQVNLRIDASGNLILSGQTLCDSNTFSIEVNSTGNSAQDFYVSDNGRTSWDISTDSTKCANEPISMTLKRSSLVPGRILSIQTSWKRLVNGNQNLSSQTHKFDFLVPCQENMFANSFNGRWTKDISVAGVPNAVNCPAPVVAHPNYPPAPINHVVVAPQPAPQAPAAPSAAQVEDYGRRQGDHMAKRVYNYYGQLENKMFSYVIGLNNGIKQYKRDAGDDETQTRDFQKGQVSGDRFGQSKGGPAGLRRADDIGTSDGRRFAISRFDSAIDRKDAGGNPFPVNKSAIVDPAIPAQQYSPECPVPETLAQAIDKQNGIESIKKMLFGYSYAGFEQGESFDRNIANNLEDFFTGFSVNDYYSAILADNFRRANFLKSYGNADWGLEMWRNKNLQDRNKPYALDYLASLSPDLQERFVMSFRDAYLLRINFLWDQNIRNIDANFEIQGMQNGQIVMNILNQQHGVVDGCQSGYFNAAKAAFDAQYPTYFGNSFSNTIQTYSQNPEIEKVTAAIFESSGKSWLPGSGVSVVVSQITNAGEIAGNLTVAPVLTSQVVKGAGDANAIVVARALSNNLKSQISPRLATIQNPPLNEGMTVMATAGGVSTSLVITVTINNVLAAIAANDSSVGLYKQYLLGYLSKEWSENSGYRMGLFGDGIYGAKGNSLLAQVVNASLTLSAAQQNVLRQGFKNDIQAVYSNGDKKKIKEANAILKNM